MTHRIVLRTSPDTREDHSGGSKLIAVSCSCLAGPLGRCRALIEARPVFPAADAVAAWTAWHAALGIEVAP